MKVKFLIMIFVFFISFVAICGCFESKKKFEDDEISFDYPSNWKTVKIMDLPGAIVGLSGDNVDVIISKKEINNTSNLESYYTTLKDNNQENLAKYCYQPISERTLKVDGVDAYEIIYKIGCDDTQTRQQQRIILFEKNGYLYTISCTIIPPEEFDKQKSNLDIVVGSFHIK
ncbi:MAG: PsbP-related protein [Methanobacteriaceae archaeon]|nr:PsbP-related protein [Methanobacteriaceae archaeon]